MSERLYNTKEKVLARGLEAIGIPLKDIDSTNRLKTGKGAIGNIIEESWFGYKINNESEPDFKEAGVELKVTPYIRNSKGIRAKERLVCNIIDYMEEYQKIFETSSFYHKCRTILLMSYEHIEGVSKGDFTIDKVVLFGFPEEDLIIIKQDWQKIIEKVRKGKAHEISEGDTLYLGACTKGTTAKTERNQPFSLVKAKQRAYSLKQSYMSYILNTYVFGNRNNEHIFKDPIELKNIGFEKYITNRIKPFIGKSQEELKKHFGVVSNAKNLNEVLLGKMLGIKGRIAYTEEFQKANIIPKTVRVQCNGYVEESMSFPIFKFKEIIQEEWETSEFKNYLEQAKFLFIIFRFNDRNDLVFDNLMFWNIPESDLEEVKEVWEKTVSTIKNGVKLHTKNNRTYNNLPKQSENRVSHVRPHGKNSSDTLELPDGRFMTKQCFWLNNTYIRSQIEVANLD